MKEKIIAILMTDQFNIGLVIALQASNYMSIQNIIDDAAQSALNDHPKETDANVLADYASDFIRIQLGMSPTR
jgi:hypothetical protein